MTKKEKELIKIWYESLYHDKIDFVEFVQHVAKLAGINIDKNNF